MRKYILFTVTALSAMTLHAQKASYDVPATLSYYGTITREEGVPYPAANYVTTNPINDGAFIWVPVGSKIMYNNTSDEGATSFEWSAPGATTDDNTAKNLIVVYNEAGTFQFPTLTAKYASGDKEFSHDLKIKVGGRAELCHSDTRKWGETWALGYDAFYNPQTENWSKGGALGGSNNRGIIGVGNFYRFSSPNMFVDGVNIYTATQPKNFGSNAKVKVRIYLPYFGETDFIMIGTSGTIGALELDDIPMGMYKTREDGAYLPIKDYGVYTMYPSFPMNCEGYPYLFFAVEGFAVTPKDEPVTEDFVIATDIMPGRELSMEDYHDALAHNSYVRSEGELDYRRPVTSFGGTNILLTKSHNFWICPLVRGAETPSGIEDIIAAEASKITLSRESDNLLVNGVSDGCTISIYGTNGTCHLTATAANGGAIFNISGLNGGVYIISTSDGASAKFVK